MTRLAIWALAALAWVPQQTPDGSIAGRLLEGESGTTPVRRASVTLAGAALGVSQMVITDDEGRFRFAGLRGGRFTLTASKAAFVTSYYGSRRPGQGPAAPIALRDGERFENLALRIFRGAVISGRVSDEFGRRWPAVPVSLLEIRLIDGERVSVPVAQTRTDDLGDYRFFGLRTSAYVVAAMATETGYEGALQSGRRVGYSPVMYPGTTDAAQATPIDVKLGDERLGVDFTLVLVPTAVIAGTVVDPNGQPVQAVQLSLVSSVYRLGFRPQTMAVIPTTPLPVQNGRFFTDALPPGRYTLFARGRGTSLWATADVTVDGRDVSDLVIALKPGLTLTGRVVFDGTAQQNLAGIRVRLTSVAAAELSLVVEPVPLAPDGSFVLAGISSGRYRVDVEGAGPAWSVQSATLADADALDNPIVFSDRDLSGTVITLTDRPSAISGTLVDALGRPAPEYRILVFPADRKLRTAYTRRILNAQPATDGHYSVVGLPAGEYFLVGVSELAPDDLSDPVFLESLIGSAIRVTIGNSESKTLNLRIGGAARPHSRRVVKR